MGIARDKLTLAQRRSIAEKLFHVTSSADADEMIGLCPFHEDTNPSFSYNPEKDAFHCLACGKSGDLAELWSHVKGYNQKDGFKAFCEAYGIELDYGGAGNTRKSKKPPDISDNGDSDEPPPLDDVYAMLGELTEPWLKGLEKERGWSGETIKALGIRLQTHLQLKSGKVKKIKSRIVWLYPSGIPKAVFAISGCINPGTVKKMKPKSFRGERPTAPPGFSPPPPMIVRRSWYARANPM
jgi:hypothetical protein